MRFRSYAVQEFWDCYGRLPESIQSLADKKYALFQENPFHPSLSLQQKGEVWTVDIGRSYRALAWRQGNVFHWYWIGSHEAYNKLLRRER